MNKLVSIKEFVTDAYGDAIRSDSMISHEQVVSDFFKYSNPKRVLEIGTSNGVSAALWATLGAEVCTLDIRESSIAEPLWKGLGIKNKIEYFICNSNEHKQQIICEHEFDLAFIDGDHSRSGVAFDYDCTFSCGMVLFHDYKPGNSTYAGLVEFVDSLTPERYTFGPPHSLFGLWIDSSHPLRKNLEFLKWLEQN